MGPGTKIVVVGDGLKVQLSQKDIDHYRNVLSEEVLKHINSTLRSKVFVDVKGYNNVAPYTRAMPGMTGWANTLGKQSFEGFGILIGLGFQVYEDAHDETLSGPQRLGRASIAILAGVVAVECPPLGLAMLGLAILRPDLQDRITRWMFSDQDPVVRGLGDVMLKVGGQSFEQWSVKYGTIDLFLNPGTR